MADIVLNEALGRAVELLKPVDGSAGPGVVLVPLSAAEADGTIKDYGTIDLATVLGIAGNTEQTSGNWNRKTITDGNVTVTVDTANDDVDIDVPDQSWDPGPTAGNDTVALLVCTDGASDSDRYVLGKLDFAVTADGNVVNAQINTNGLFTAS